MRPDPPADAGHRPWLDGVRGVSVLLVLVDHVVSGRLGVGRSGVGVFFGLSGYLITGLLLDQHEDGGVRLARFYAHRAARLFPALLLAVVGAVLALSLVGDRPALVATLAALSYTSNYYTVVAGFSSAYGHLWSLAVEEHFYLVWPVVLPLLLRWWGRRGALLGTLVLCALAPVLRVVELHSPLPDVLSYVGSAERADALLWGCAAALLLRDGRRPPAWTAPACVLLLAVQAALVGSGVPRLQSMLGWSVLAVLAAGLVSGLDAHPGLLRSGLSARPLVGLGLVSYGLYLYHYPALAFASHAGLGMPGRVAAGVLSVPLAAASYVWVEAPVRRTVRRRTAGWGEPAGRQVGATTG